MEGSCVNIKFAPHSIVQILAGKKLVTRRTHNLAIVNILPDSWKLNGYGYDDRGVCIANFTHNITSRWEVCKSKYHQGQQFEVGGKTIEVTGIEVWKVQSITNTDVTLEGAANKEEFIKTWDSIYLVFQHGWERNPWCWRYRFKVVR